MAAILFNKGERSLIDVWLAGQGGTAYSPSGQTDRIAPAPGTTPVTNAWGVGMGQTAIGSLTKASVLAGIIELGTSAANGYARQGILRDTTGWPASTLVSNSYQTTGPQVSFVFTGAPNPNGANCWFVAGSTVTSHDNALFGADTAATRTFANGDTERITPTYRQT